MALSKSLEREIGHAAPLSTWGGLVVDATETTPELAWPLSIQVYDRMDTTDAQVGAVLNAVVLSILQPRAKRYAMSPQAARDEVTEGIADDLGLPIVGDPPKPRARVRGRFSWTEHLRVAARYSLVHGHMPFEQVYRIDGAGRAHLAKLAPRMPDTIARIVTARDGGLERIEQHAPGAAAIVSGGVTGVTNIWGAVPIPVDRLVWYSTDRRPGNWLGTSILRKAYKHWLLKDRLLRVDAMRHERNGMGVPVVEAGPGATPDDMATLADMAMRFRAGESAGGAMPHGSKLRLVGVEGSLSDTLASIRYHDEQIAGLMLTQFLKLGTTQTGSRALAESTIDFFELALLAVIAGLLDVTNAHVVEDLVDLNYGPDEPAPMIVLEDVDNVDEDQGPAGETPPVAPARAGARRRTIKAAGSVPDRPLRRERFDHEVAAATDFAALDAAHVSATDSLVEAWQQVRGAQIDEVVAAVETLVDAGDIAGLAALSVAAGNAEALAATLVDTATTAAAQASAEAAAQGVGIAVGELNEEVAERLAARAAATDRIIANDLAGVASRQAVRRAGPEISGADVAAGVRTALEDLSDAVLSDELGGAVTQAQNEGRREVMGAAAATYYASELLDEATCSACSSVDGRSYDSLSGADADYPTGGHVNCLGGARCRGTIVAVYDEAEPST